MPISPLLFHEASTPVQSGSKCFWEALLRTENRSALMVPLGSAAAAAAWVEALTPSLVCLGLGGFWPTPWGVLGVSSAGVMSCTLPRPWWGGRGSYYGGGFCSEGSPVSLGVRLLAAAERGVSVTLSLGPLDESVPAPRHGLAQASHASMCQEGCCLFLWEQLLGHVCPCWGMMVFVLDTWRD